MPFFRKNIKKLPVRLMEYLSSVAIRFPNSTKGEIHITFRPNPKDSWESITRVLTLEQAIRMHAELGDNIALLRESGVAMPIRGGKRNG